MTRTTTLDNDHELSVQPTQFSPSLVQGIVALYPMTQIVTGTTRSYLEKDYAITVDGAGWATSMYVYGDLRLLHPFQSGELFNAVRKHDEKLIRKRFRYPGQEDFQFSNLTRAAEVDRHGLSVIFDSRVSPLLAPDLLLKKVCQNFLF